MPFLKLVSCFLLLAFFNSDATEADGPVYFGHCTINKNFTSNRPYQFNLNTLLSKLSSQAAGSAEFYNTTAGNAKTNDAVYGQFMCRGDVPHRLCQDCVANATQRIASECPHNKKAIIWYEECMVRYSHRSFFSTLDTEPKLMKHGPDVGLALSQLRYIPELSGTLDEVVAEAAPGGAKKFSKKEGLDCRCG